MGMLKSFIMRKKKKNLDQLMLFAEDFLANLFPPQEKETAGKMTVSSGLKCFELYERSGPLMSLVKMLLGSSVWNPGLYSAKYRLIWKAKDTKCGDLYYQLSLSELPTKETGYGLLLTPNVVMHEEHPEDYKSRTIKKKYNRNNEWTSLAAQIRYMDLLPTPASQEPGFNPETRNPVDKEGNQVMTHNHRWYDPKTGRLMQKGLSHAIWVSGTQTSRDWNTGDMTNVPENGLLGGQIANLIPAPKASDGIKGKGGPNGYVKTLGKAIEGTNGANTGMKLQPAFVEWMMGYPNGWTQVIAGQFTRPLSTSARKKLDGKLDLIAQKSRSFAQRD